MRTKLIKCISILLLSHVSIKFTDATTVKPAGVLRQNWMKKLFLNSLGLSSCSHNPKGNLYVAKNQGSNSYSNIIQDQPEKKIIVNFSETEAQLFSLVTKKMKFVIIFD